MEVEISGVVKLPLQPTKSVKKAPRKMDKLKSSKTDAKLNLNLNSLLLLNNFVDNCETPVETKKYLKYSVIKMGNGHSQVRSSH